MSISHKSSFRPAFTLMEMMVAVGILVVLILGVGVIFQSVSKTVGVSQASMDMLSGVRSIQRQIDADVAGINKDAFLVIRCRKDANGNRYDQISFISYGSFSNRTGTANGNFSDNTTVAPAAFIWWGQLALEKTGGSNASPSSTTTLLNAAAPDYSVPLDQVPTMTPAGDFILGRHTTLLISQNDAGNNSSPNGVSVAGYPGSSAAPRAAIDYLNTNFIAPDTNESQYQITQSRVSIAEMTSQQIMSSVIQDIAVNTRSAPANLRFEADHYCYRYGALYSPYDGTNTSNGLSLVNGYFRMHPIALQGVSFFAIDWTDGSTYAGGEKDVTSSNNTVDTSLIGTTKWYGEYDSTHGLAKGGAYAQGFVDPGYPGVSPAPVPAQVSTTSRNGDDYTAVFSYDNRSLWPVALRFRYHVTDKTGRLPNGRDFVQVVKLP